MKLSQNESQSTPFIARIIWCRHLSDLSALSADRQASVADFRRACFSSPILSLRARHGGAWQSLSTVYLKGETATSAFSRLLRKTSFPPCHCEPQNQWVEAASAAWREAISSFGRTRRDRHSPPRGLRDDRMGACVSHHQHPKPTGAPESQ